jgi:hypothetical protein
MATFVAIYRGETVAGARLIALSADPALVAEVSARILAEHASENPDPIVACVDNGRRAALRLIAREVEDEGA